MAFEIGSLDITYASDGNPMPGLRRLSGTETESQDGLRNTIASTTPEPSVAGLRDRLLREARQERIRCLQVARASERWRADEGGSAFAVTTTDSATQTDPIVINEFGSNFGSAPGMDLDSTSKAAVWSQSDEEAQMDAIRTIQMLSNKKADTTMTDRRIAELEEMLMNERARVQEVEAKFGKEKQKREALQQQVLTLEAEMDGKESTLQAQQRVLERTEMQPYDMQLVPVNQRSHSREITLRARSPLPPNAQNGRGVDRMNMTLPATNRYAAVGGRSKSPISRTNLPTRDLVDEANLLAARRQLQERDSSLNIKDQEISQLLRELRQPDPSPTHYDNYDRGSYNVPMASTISFGNRR